jgi:hypothetical protein
MNCNECLSLIETVLDGELPVEATALANSHAETCKLCSSHKDNLITLHERTSSLVENIIVPPGLEQRIRLALADEVKRSQRPKLLVLFQRTNVRKLSIAAAVMVLFSATCLIYSSKSTQKIAQFKTEDTAVKPAVILVSANDLVEHTQNHVVSNFHYSPSQLPNLNKQSGFNIEPPKLVGWRLGDICVCSIGKDGQPVVHMTYVKNAPVKIGGKNRHPRILTCYQVLRGHIDGNGMSNLADSSQKPVRFASSKNFAIALVENPEVETVFVAAMPVKEITSIAEHS